MPAEDELAQTATAPEGPAARARGESLGRKLGRYVIERELGEGGMGVVHAAFDPDLERRVALKVLRREGMSEQAEQRLLREARAMARLTHPNVVTVYEVGTASGEDFVAMELVDGTSLADWLRAEPRSEREIVAAYLDAGRGLAAAHAAGIVHRDFKPHNVLRSRSGRIAVTDFGLAREAEVPLVAPVDASVDAPVDAMTADAAASRDTPTSLSGLTVPGSVLGTPAYMAPEQWEGETVSPATDQFAFCVALWEALAGERPYRGTTMEQLRDQVSRGPAELDTSKLPRRLRAPLVRGLAPEPGQRWPSMTALLDQLAPRGRAPWIVIGLVATTILAVGVALYAMREGPTPAAVVASCEAPALDPDRVWNPAIDAAIRPHAPRSAQRFADEVAQWKVARHDACMQPDSVRRSRLGCLDRVLVRIDALRRARLLDLQAPADGMIAQLYPASVCVLDQPPRLPERYSDAAVVGMAVRAGAQISEEVHARAKAATDGDPCAAAYLGIIETARTRSLRVAEASRSAAQLCGDDQAYGATTMNVVSMKTTAFLVPDLPEMLVEGERAVARAAQPNLRAQLELAKSQLAQRAGNHEGALRHADEALRGPLPLATKFAVVYMKLQILLDRGRPDDLVALQRETAGWKAAAIVSWGPANVPAWLEWFDATAQWRLGELEPAHARFAGLARAAPRSPSSRTVRGTVVDAAGKPIGGARVAAGMLVGDAVSIAVPLFDPGGQPPEPSETTTDASGRFTLDRAPGDGVVVAQLGTLRSRASALRDGVRLKLEPTTTGHGRVRIVGDRHGDLWVTATALPDTGYEIIAPILGDGTFTLAGLPVGPVELVVTRQVGSYRGLGPRRVVDASAGPLGDLELEAPSTRTIHVVVRGETSAPVHGALVFGSAGTIQPRTIGELPAAAHQTSEELARAVIGTPPPEIAAQVRRGDVLARLPVPAGPATVCASGIQIDPAITDLAGWMQQRRGALDLRCKPLRPDASVIVIDVPPMKRFD